MEKEDEKYIEYLIDDKLEKINDGYNVYDIGFVTEVKDFIIYASGLNNISFYEKVDIAGKAIGYVMKLNPNQVVIALLNQKEKIEVGDQVYQTGQEYEGEFSESSIGRMIDMFGNDKLTNMKYQNIIKVPIEYENIPLMDRTKVQRPLYTGISGIDLIYPIGKGQRQLIIGDKKTGKTQLCLDTIVNQQNKNVLCIYVAIGKTKKEVKEIYYELLKKGAMKYTIIITAFNEEFPSVLTLTPYYALSVARYFMLKRMDVLVVLDDLKRHADAYREISLLSGKAPGRDAYPSDIFYFHSRLLEKGCQYKNGASITILPIVETTGGDITDYISTNIISITDGQIVLSSKNFQKGEKPAIDYGLSVSRLGGAVQDKEVKQLGAKIRSELLSYLETRDVYELANIDEMSKELRDSIFKGQKIVENLKQYKFSPLTPEEIVNKFNSLEGINNGEY